MERYLVCADKTWLPFRTSRLEGAFVHISDPSELTVGFLSGLKPRYIFFPYWSQIIPPEIYENYECVMFHMTDLPYGRGGSPLQNLIVHSHKDTKLTAFRCTGEVDAGPVYLKRALSLYGDAREILDRASNLIEKMVAYIVNENPVTMEQTGHPVVWRRRKPAESNIADYPMMKAEGLYNHIRMLDAESYPHAYLEVNGNRFEFTEAQLIGDTVRAKVNVVCPPSLTIH